MCQITKKNGRCFKLRQECVCLIHFRECLLCFGLREECLYLETPNGPFFLLSAQCRIPQKYERMLLLIKHQDECYICSRLAKELFVLEIRGKIALCLRVQEEGSVPEGWRQMPCVLDKDKGCFMLSNDIWC